MPISMTACAFHIETSLQGRRPARACTSHPNMRSSQSSSKPPMLDQPLDRRMLHGQEQVYYTSRFRCECDISFCISGFARQATADRARLKLINTATTYQRISVPPAFHANYRVQKSRTAQPFPLIPASCILHPASPAALAERAFAFACRAFCWSACSRFAAGRRSLEHYRPFAE